MNLMELRKELYPLPVSQSLVDELTTIARAIVSSGDARERNELIERFNTRTNSDNSFEDFHCAEEGEGLENFVLRRLNGRPPKIDNISDAEFIEIISRLCSGTVPQSLEAYWIELLEINLGNPHVIDIIYGGDGNATAAEKLARMKSYRPYYL